MLDPLDDELGDAIAALDLERLGRVGVEENDLELAPVAGVDESRTVEDRHAVFVGQAAAGLHEPCVPGRDGDGGAGGNESPASGRRERESRGGQQIGARIAVGRIAWNVEPGVEAQKGYLQHGADHSPPAGVDHDRAALPYGGHVLAWMDLEMTGLDPDRHVVVEIATIITDDDLAIVAEGPDLVIHQSPEGLESMDEFVRQMHTRSGLLDQIAASTISLADARDQTMAFLKEHIGEERTVPLCGNSIGTDRRFLAKHLPEIEEFLHYRSIDVSTVKELTKRWYPNLLSKAPKKAAGHRALDDIRESIAELAYYRSAVFIEPPG